MSTGCVSEKLFEPCIAMSLVGNHDKHRHSNNLGTIRQEKRQVHNHSRERKIKEAVCHEIFQNSSSGKLSET